MRYAQQDMSAPATVVAPDRHAEYNKSRLFLVSVIALVTAGMAYSLRSNVASDLQRIFLDPIDKAHSGEMVASILGVPFVGFALTIAIGSPMLDFIGMALLLPLSGLCFLIGTSLLIFAGSISSGAGVYNVLWSGALLCGIGWGMVETVINPLMATLYPDDKTTKLNHLHAWWPGGLIIGGLLGVGMSNLGMDWKAKLVCVMIPAVVVIVMCLGMKFPPTERVAAGVSTGEMFRELAQPMFLLLFCCMFLTAASELAPGSWVDFALSRTVHMPGILLLVYVSGIMFVARHFAGPLVHKLSPIGLLWISCLLAACGLIFLSMADSPVMGVLAATVWGCGVCFMWPTMLATASERFPHGGALLMGLMGTAGTASIYFVLPQMGKIFDNEAARLAGGADRLKTLVDGSPELDHIKGLAAQLSFKEVAILPAILLVVFGGIWLYDRSKGGFKAKKIS
jgi:MFS family permease